MDNTDFYPLTCREEAITENSGLFRIPRKTAHQEYVGLDFFVVPMPTAYILKTQWLHAQSKMKRLLDVDIAD